MAPPAAFREREWLLGNRRGPHGPRLTGNDELIAAARTHEQYVRAETLTTNPISYEAQLPDPIRIETVKIDGGELEVTVQKARDMGDP